MTALTLARRHSVTAAKAVTAQRLLMYATLLGCDAVTALSAVACPCALELRAVVATSAGAPVPLRRDRRRSDRRGWRSRCHDSPRNDAAAVAIGRKSWPFEIRSTRGSSALIQVRYQELRYIAAGDERTVATNGLESGRFQGFWWVLTGNMSDQVITVRCGNFFAWKL